MVAAQPRCARALSAPVQLDRACALELRMRQLDESLSAACKTRQTPANISVQRYSDVIHISVKLSVILHVNIEVMDKLDNISKLLP